MGLMLSTKEIGVLMLQMEVMKKHIKKGLKKAYKFEWKDKYNQFIGLKEQFEIILNEAIPDQGMILIHLTKDQFAMLHSFINWYVAELNKKENNKSKLDPKAIELMALLEEIQSKTNKLAG